MKIKYMIFLVFSFLNVCSFSIKNDESDKNVLLQTFNVKFEPKSNNNVYSILSSDGERAVIDLGHFNGKDENIKIMLGNISVKIDIKTLKSGNSEIEVESINHKKLGDFFWNYTYDITHFIGAGTPTATITIENLKIGSYRGYLSENDISTFGDEPEFDLLYFEYSFDMVLDLKNLSLNSMYGFSPHKNETTGKAYINIKDIILDQLRGSSGMR